MSKEPKYKIGDKVIHEIGDDVEVGVVVWVWRSLGGEEDPLFDCYVAFFEGAFPEGDPNSPPYIMRYSDTALRPYDD